ncbi:MAG: hypothetical protein OEM82_07070, partial [Acidobacteriota bacterium]|nr:hypothetical protein [Acidobacteriota bacterium]
MAEHAISAEEAGKHPAVCAAYIVEGISNADAKSSATEAVVGHFLSVDDVDSAAAFADALEDPFTRDRLLLAVIAKCIELKDDSYAFQLLEAVEEPGLRSGGIEAVAHSLAGRGDFEKALETAKGLEHSSDSTAGIAIAQAKNGLTDAALETIESIEYFRAKVKAFIEISAQYLEKNEYDEAKLWLAKAGDAIPGVEFEEDRIRGLNEIANCYLEAEDRESAADYFLKASAEAAKLDSGHRDSFLVAAAIGLLKSGNVEIADETLDLVEDKTQVASCLFGFSRVYEKEEPEDARETIEEALAMLNSQSEYEIRSTKDRNEMYGAV